MTMIVVCEQVDCGMRSRPRTPTPSSARSSTMTAEPKSTRKRTCPDESTDNSAPVTPRKRQATGLSRSSGTATPADASSENTPDLDVVRSPYFSPPKKTNGNARKKRLLAASHNLLNENSRFVKRPLGTRSPAELAEITGRDRPRVTEATTAITEHLVSEFSKSKFRKRKTRKDPGPPVPDETGEFHADKIDLTALEKQVCLCTSLAAI